MSLEPAKRRREQSRADARRIILDATEALLVEVLEFRNDKISAIRDYHKRT